MAQAWLDLELGWSLLTILATTLVYRLALHAFERSGRNSLLHPLITAPLVIAGTLVLFSVDFTRYESGAQILTWMLGPATVALAIPLYHQASNIRRHGAAVILTTLLGGAIAVALAMGAAALAGADQEVIRSLASKSVTTPIALSLSELLGGIAQLAAGAVIITGVCGALCGPPLLHSMGITDNRVIGFTLGVTAHGIGTARAFTIDRQAGAYASLGMGLTGMLTAFILPLILR